MEDNYFENRVENVTIRIRKILESFPSFSNAFFIGTQMRTSELTRLNYAYDLRIFFDYLCKKLYKNSIDVSEITLEDLECLTAQDIEEYLEYLTSYTYCGKKYKCGENAKQRKLSTLRSFFNYFYKKSMLPSNITAKVEMPKIHDKSIIKLEANEVVKLLNLAESGENMTKQQKSYNLITRTRDVAILTLFLGTGIRISECVGLNKTDIDFETNGFSVTRKGGNKSILYFSDEVATALSDYLKWVDNEIENKTNFSKKITNNDALFLSLQGNRISIRAVELLVKKYSKIISPLKKITPHKLRSTYGTALYQETQDIYIVAEVLGHKDINTTKKHYAAMSDSIRRNAANAVKLRDSSTDDSKK